MLSLNAPQVQRLQDIQRRRDLASLGSRLAALFPDVPGRLADRYPALIAHGVQRGQAHGLDHLLALARYLACWFVLGAEFEARPEHAWAARLLGDRQRSEGAKVFQLCRRTREALQAAGAAAVLAPAAFEAAIGRLDEALRDAGDIGALQHDRRLVLGQACDLDALEIRRLEGQPLKQYTWTQGQWQLLPVPPRPGHVVVSSLGGGTADTLPAWLSALGQGDSLARLRVRTRCAHCCDPLLHPHVLHQSPTLPQEWRGPLSADLQLDLAAAAADDTPPGPGLQPVLVVETPPAMHRLSLAACGLRDDGPAMGEQVTDIVVHDAVQHLVSWHREPGPTLTWPEPAGGQLPAPAPRCRIERDGVALDTTGWLAGLAALDAQLAVSLGRLATAWGREAGLERTRVEATPAVLSGDAALTWGWIDAAEGITGMPWLRVAAQFALSACQLDLQLVGDLVLQGALCRLTLQSQGRPRQALDWARPDPQAPLLPGAPLGQGAFRQPFVLRVEPFAQDSLAFVDASPVCGALVGECGLRQREDGPGWQWFAKLSLEAVRADLRWLDPLLGEQAWTQTLLPDQVLLDWSLG